AAAPPTAPFAGLPQLAELVLEPRQQVFGRKPEPALIESLALRLDDALLHGLVLPAQVNNLLLQVALLGQPTLQGGLDRHGFSPELRGRGPGSGDLVAQRVVGAVGRVQLT